MQAEDGIGCADVTGVQTCALPISAKGCVRVTVHAGEPGASIPPVRARIEAGWGARAYDHAGMTEVGAYGYECAEQAGLPRNESRVIAPGVEPATRGPPRDREPLLTKLRRVRLALVPLPNR